LIYQSIKAAYQGNVVIHPQVASKILTHTITKVDLLGVGKKFGLTEQELKMIFQVAEGKSNKEIAQGFYLTEGTVKNQMSQILAKLNLKNRTQLTIFAYEQGIKN